MLGPFQGKVACVRILLGKGVCGTAAAENRIQRIGNVHVFPGHIACDAASNAEIVLPITMDERVVGVLGIDSTIFINASIRMIRWTEGGGGLTLPAVGTTNMRKFITNT